jgi:hypothetical protein
VKKKKCRNAPSICPSPHPSLNYSAQRSVGTAFRRVPAQFNLCVQLLAYAYVYGQRYSRNGACECSWSRHMIACTCVIPDIIVQLRSMVPLEVILNIEVTLLFTRWQTVPQYHDLRTKHRSMLVWLSTCATWYVQNNLEVHVATICNRFKIAVLPVSVK